VIGFGRGLDCGVGVALTTRPPGRHISNRRQGSAVPRTGRVVFARAQGRAAAHEREALIGARLSRAAFTSLHLAHPL
jgi:hypothetical protein